jgi:hypothetical protein
MLIVGAVFLLFISWSVIEGISGAYDIYRFNHLSSAAHLRQAKDICRSELASISCNSEIERLLETREVGKTAALDEASRHLERIPASAPEHSEASQLLAAIRLEQAERRRCAAIEQIEEERREEQARAAHERREEEPKTEQERRDDDAWIFSYWSTTMRVDTDIDSFWLPNEERTCQTYPDNKGRVAVVACNAEGSHRDHNIPVKFWGGVGRGTVSDWKCRREGDEFVCRAID